MDKDPRPIVKALGIKLIEIESLLDAPALYAAYRKAYELAQDGRPTLIYPTGCEKATCARSAKSSASPPR